MCLGGVTAAPPFFKTIHYGRAKEHQGDYQGALS